MPPYSEYSLSRILLKLKILKITTNIHVLLIEKSFFACSVLFPVCSSVILGWDSNSALFLWPESDYKKNITELPTPTSFPACISGLRATFPAVPKVGKTSSRWDGVDKKGFSSQLNTIESKKLFFLKHIPVLKWDNSLRVSWK